MLHTSILIHLAPYRRWPRSPAQSISSAPSPRPAYFLAEWAVFVHRLITARKYAGRGLGAELIDWAGLRGQRLYGARWIRIDVWSTNQGLHDYYMKRGFQPCGFCADPAYPSGALFQKPVSAIERPGIPQFVESPDRSEVGGQLEPSQLLTPALT